MLDTALGILLLLVLLAFPLWSEWLTEQRVLARLSWGVRTRAGRRMPAGYHRVEGEVGVSFGPGDEHIMFRVPALRPDGPRSGRYVCVTDSATVFVVNERIATPDELLEAYDDELGPLELRIDTPGKIARVSIAADRPSPIGAEPAARADSSS